MAMLHLPGLPSHSGEPLLRIMVPGPCLQGHGLRAKFRASGLPGYRRGPTGSLVYREGLAKPGDRWRKPLMQGNPRFPPKQLLASADIRAAPPRVILYGWQVVDRVGAAKQPLHRHGEFQDGELLGVAQIYRPGRLRLHLHQAEEPLDQVRDVAEGATLLSAAVDRHRPAAEALGDEVRDDASVVGPHPRAVSVEDPGHA